MAITINLDDANNDGKGINFGAYLKNFDKRYFSNGYGGFINEEEQGSIPGGDYVVHGDDYVTWDGKKNGQSVIFEGAEEGWTYDFFNNHIMSGDIQAIVFGTGTKSSKNVPEYTNNGEIRIAFEAFDVNNWSKSWLSDISGGETKSLLKFLNSDSIDLVGSDGKDTFTGFAKADTLHGEGGGDKLNGGKGADMIWGDEGNDRLAGGAGADTFVFEAGDGNDRISDFRAGEVGTDIIDFGGLFATFDDVLEAATQTKAGVRIEYDGGSVLLMGVKEAALTAGDFDLTV